jgi:hypothetical protein
MGLVSNDLGDWLAETPGEPESVENPFGENAEHAALGQVHALWHRAAHRIHRWIDAERDPETHHGDGLTR